MSPQQFLNIAALVAALILVLGLVMVLWRAVTTHNDARRAVVSDLIFLVIAAAFCVYALTNRVSIVYEVVMFTGFFGALSTAAYARIITRGRR